MSIDPNVLTAGIFSIAGTIAGAALTIFANSRQDAQRSLEKRNEVLAHELRKAANQVAAYHALESEYAHDLAKQRGVSERTVKTEFRDRVEIGNYERPTWTEREARIAIEVAGGLVTATST